MRKDFVAFILTHGRAGNVKTLDSLRKCGYTGDVVLVIDDEDKDGEKYKELYGRENVEVFSKDEVGKTFDRGDNFGKKGVIIYARNVCFDLARKRGYRYFIELDDDYTVFETRMTKNLEWTNNVITDLDGILTEMLEYYIKSGILTLAMGQGGDYVGGRGSELGRMLTKRKAMNSFICSVDRPFKFVGSINEDVNTYTSEGLRGKIFLTIPIVMLDQVTTQKNKGGMTETYLDSGTYVKSFYSVMYTPSAVKVGVMGGNTEKRIHHKISWNNCVPKILSEKYKKDGQTDKVQ